jgi:integrase
VLEEQDAVMAASFKMRLLTARRGKEVLTMRRPNIDGEWWTILAEIAKNGHSHRVPLSALALSVLDTLQDGTAECDWVFPSPKISTEPIVQVHKAAEQLVKLSGINFAPHDLRRTAASHMTSLGGSSAGCV